MFGKLLFVDDDVRAGAKLPDGALKKISEAKLLTGEHKFKPAFTFVNRAFPMLLCNNLCQIASNRDPLSLPIATPSGREEYQGI